MNTAELVVVSLCLWILGAAVLDLYRFLNRRARNQRRQRAALMRDFRASNFNRN